MKNAVSPLRYPGGKSWLTPFVVEWLKSLGPVDHFVEPFCGGGSVGLSIGLADIVGRVYFADIDPQINNFWRVVFSPIFNAELQNLINHFEFSPETVNSLLAEHKLQFIDLAFQTLIKNRVNYGGILHKNARPMKSGDGKGLASRWYPKTIINRLEAIKAKQKEPKPVFNFVNYLAFDVISSWSQPKTVFFVDPPYTLGNKKAGKNLYDYSALDHNKLFSYMAGLSYPFLMTYDNDPHVMALASEYGLTVEKVAMKTNHHTTSHELVIRGKHG